MNALALWKARPPAERAKMALIPVLLVAFGGVLYGRFIGTSAGGSPKAVELAPPSPAAAGPGASTSTASGAGKTTVRQRPRANLPEVIANNPFRRPLRPAVPDLSEPAEAEATTTESEPAANEPPESDSALIVVEAEEVPRAPRRWPQKVQAVFIDEQGAAAIVDGRVVRLGDLLESGARVVEISATAVMFEMP